MVLLKDYTKYLSEASSVSDLFGRIIGSISNGVKKLGSGIVGLVTGGFDKLKTSASDSNTILGKVFDTISKWNVVDRLKQSFSTLGTVFDGFWGAIKQAFSNIDFSSKTALIKSGIEEIGKLLEWLADRFKTVSDVGGKVFTYLAEFFDSVGANIGKFIKDIGKMFGFGNDSNAKNSLSFLERMANAFKNLTDKLLKWSQAFAKGPQPGETDKIAVAFSKAGDAVKWFLDVIKLLLTPLQLVWDTLKGFFDVLKSSFDMPISDKLGSLSSILKTVKKRH